MRIEDHWNDGIVYEIEYEVVLNNQKQIYNSLLCCSQEVDEEDVKKIISKKIKSKFENCKSVYTNELYEVLIDKKILESKIVCRLERGSLFRISFSTCQNQRMKKIDKMILVKENTPHAKLVTDIKQKFTNVLEVHMVNHFENILTLL